MTVSKSASYIKHTLFRFEKRIAYRRTLEKWLNDGTPSKEKKLETYQRRLEFWENLSSVWIRREKNALPLFVGPSQKWQRGSCCRSEADNGGFHANFDAATNTAIVLMLYSTKYFCIKTEYVRFLFFFCTENMYFVFVLIFYALFSFHFLFFMFRELEVLNLNLKFLLLKMLRIFVVKF